MSRPAVADGACSLATRPNGRVRALSVIVVALAVANVATLWIARGEFVCGWDTVGASFGAQALNQGSFLDGVRTIGAAVVHQRGRPAFTGGESFIYGFLPGMLNNLWPWVLWGNLVVLVLFTGVSAWLVRRLGGRWWIFAGCVLASPALTSQSMVAYPYLASNTLAYGLAIGWVLSSRPRGPVLGGLLDIVVFAAIAAIAFQGYESAKTFFIVPVIAAFTRKGVPVWRRLLWLGCAGSIAWLVHDLAAGTTLGALKSIPHDPATFARGVLRAARDYFLDTYIDFPALAVAAAIALPFLRRDRLFWSVLFVAICGLVSLNAFEFDGGFLVPHRFLLLALVSALIVTLLLSDGVRGPGVVVVALVAVGMTYSTRVTIDFALHRPSEGARYRDGSIYALPYNHAKVDGPIKPD